MFNISEQEKNRILGLHLKLLNEQNKNYADIAHNFHSMTKGSVFGTDNEGVVSLIKSFNNAQEFNQFLSELKKIIITKSFESIINDEFGRNDLKYIDEITNHLVKIGVLASYNTFFMGGIKKFAPGSFKIGTKSIQPTKDNNKPSPSDTKVPVSASTPSPKNPNKPKVYAEKFPLIFQMKGENVLKLQKKLGVKPTGYFYTLTEASVIKKMKELGLTYNRKTGVDINTFNKILNSTTTPIKSTADEFAKAKEIGQQYGVELKGLPKS